MTTAPKDGLDTSWKDIRKRKDLSATAKLIWRTLEMICSSKGRARVSSRWLATDTGVSVGAVHKCIKKLLVLNLITEDRSWSHGRSVYQIVRNGVHKVNTSVPKVNTDVFKSEHLHDRHGNNTVLEVRENTPGKAWEMFWTAYPRKESKAKAAEIWKRKKLKLKWVEILVGLERHKASAQWQRDGGQYIPHAATWLNQERWIDEPLQSVSDKPKLTPADQWVKQG